MAIPGDDVQKIVALSRNLWHRKRCNAPWKTPGPIKPFSCEYVANLLEQRERPTVQPGALHLTRQQDLLELDLPAPDLSLYESEEGGVP